MSVPGWPSIDDEVIPDPRPDPYPSNISEFDSAILHFVGACEDARGQAMRVRDCRKHETRTIAEDRIYIARLQKMIAQCQAELFRKQAQGRPESEIERLQHHIETATLNIESAQAQIEESEAALQICTRELEKAWERERGERQAILSTLRQYRRQGIDPNTQDTRLCGGINVDKSRCNNRKEFIPWKWRPCHKHRSATP